MKKRGNLGEITDPLTTGLQPTVAGLGLPVLIPTVEVLQGTLDFLKKRQEIPSVPSDGVIPTVQGLLAGDEQSAGVIATVKELLAGGEDSAGVIATLKELLSGSAPSVEARGNVGEITDPLTTGLQPTVAGLGLAVLNPTVEGLQGALDVLKKRQALGEITDPLLTGLQPTVAGLGLGVLNPTVEGLQGALEVA